MSTYEQMELFSDHARVDVVDTASGIHEHEDPGSRALSEYLAMYDVVSARSGDNSYIVMAERDPGMTEDFALTELGYSSPSPWTAWTRQERVPELRDRNGLMTYYRMRRQDGVVRGALQLLKTPVRSAHWFLEPGSDSSRDKKIAEFVSDNLFNRLNVSWSKLLDDILLMLDYGYMPFEKVYDKIDSDGKLRLRKLAPRHPLDVRSWDYDARGGPDGVWMETNQPNIDERGIFIPIEKLVVFSNEPEGGDLTGISMMRPMYKHWYYKDTLYKIDAIQKERHGIGVPVIKLPMGYSPGDKAMAENLGRNLRTNERAHIVLPQNWEVFFAKIEGQPVNCLDSINHHDDEIMSSVLGPFLKSQVGTKDALEIFYKSVRYIASSVTDIINRHVIKQLVDFNFALGSDRKYPTLHSRRIGEWEDIRTMSFALRNLVGAGIIRPDDELEKYTRKELDMPPVDEATIRATKASPAGAVPGTNLPGATPPKPARVGAPRQTGNAPVTPGNARSGDDVSGG